MTTPIDDLPAGQPQISDGSVIVDQREAAETAGLTYVSDEEPGIRRKKAGSGFTYVDASGSTIRDPHVLKRIRSLAIPPAYKMSGSAPTRRPHPGDRPRRKRSQAIPVPSHVARSAMARNTNTCSNLQRPCRPSGKALDEDMAKSRLCREKVLATVVHLLETTLIRVGNDDMPSRTRAMA